MGTSSGRDIMGVGGHRNEMYKGVANYTVLTATNNISTSSAVGRAAVGAALIGPAGLLAGFTAKRKPKYTIQVVWGDGATSILELDEQGYQTFASIMQVTGL